MLVQTVVKVSIVRTHRRKIHILARSARELTSVKISLVDAMEPSRLSFLGGQQKGRSVDGEVDTRLGSM